LDGSGGIGTAGSDECRFRRSRLVRTGGRRSRAVLADVPAVGPAEAGTLATEATALLFNAVEDSDAGTLRRNGCASPARAAFVGEVETGCSCG